MNLEKIGKFIAQKRKEKNLTQAELAEKLNVSDKAISKWERGICLMDMSLLIPLSEILDVTVNEILAGEMIAKDNTTLLNNAAVSGIKSYQKKLKKKIFWVFGILYLLIVIPCFIYILVCLFNIPIPGPKSMKDIKTAHVFYDALLEKDLDKIELMITNPYNPNVLLAKTPFKSIKLISIDSFMDKIKSFYDDGGKLVSFKGKRQNGIFNSLEMTYELCAELDGDYGCIDLTIEDFHEHAYFTASAIWDPTKEKLTKRIITMFEPYDLENIDNK